MVSSYASKQQDRKNEVYDSQTHRPATGTSVSGMRRLSPARIRERNLNSEEGSNHGRQDVFRVENQNHRGERELNCIRGKTAMLPTAKPDRKLTCPGRKPRLACTVAIRPPTRFRPRASDGCYRIGGNERSSFLGMRESARDDAGLCNEVAQRPLVWVCDDQSFRRIWFARDLYHCILHVRGMNEYIHDSRTANRCSSGSFASCVASRIPNGGRGNYVQIIHQNLLPAVERVMPSTALSKSRRASHPPGVNQHPSVQVTTFDDNLWWEDLAQARYPKVVWKSRCFYDGCYREGAMDIWDSL